MFHHEKIIQRYIRKLKRDEVLVVSTASYLKKLAGDSPLVDPDFKNEKSIVHQHQFDQFHEKTKFVPITFEKDDQHFIPLFYQGLHFFFWPDDYIELYRFLTAQNSLSNSDPGEGEESATMETVIEQEVTLSKFDFEEIPLPERLTPFPENVPKLLSRKDDLNTIARYFRNHTGLLGIWGRSGIGKTVLALDYLHQFKETYQYVGWVDFEISLPCSLFRSLSSFFHLKEFTSENYKRLSEKLNNLEGKKLLVLNDFNGKENILNELPTNFDLLIIMEREPKFAAMTLEPLRFVQAKELFQSFFSQEVGKVILTALFESIDYNTMAIAMIGRISELSLEENSKNFLMLLKGKEFRKGSDFFYHLTTLLRYSPLNQYQIWVLRTLSLLPVGEFSIKSLIQLFQIQDPEGMIFMKAAQRLVRCGWLQQTGYGLRMIPAIREFLREVIPPDFNECKGIIQNIALKLAAQSIRNENNPCYWLPFAQTILNTFPQVQNDLLDELEDHLKHPSELL